MTTNNVTVTINNQTVTADLSTIAALLNMAVETSMEKQPKPRATAKLETSAKAQRREAKRAKHDAILDTKRIGRMTKTATDKIVASGFTVDHVGKQGKWVWVYPAKDRKACHEYVKAHPEFKNVKLAKGWNYSAKRAAYFRDFS